MVKIAIAGCSGNVAQEIIDVLVATRKHDILLLSRKDVLVERTPGLTWVKTNYDDLTHLVEVLRGVHTVLSFITPQTDVGNVAQRTLIDAAVLASVRRFAPSEWAGSGVENMSWNTGKRVIREYLREVNKDKKILEYTLFQPGMFTNYLTSPHKSSTHIHPFQTHLDFSNRRAIVLEESDSATISFTTAQDLANVVALAVEYEGEWPIVGGIKADELSIAQIIALGEKIRGAPFAIEKLKSDDVKTGIVNASWLPRVDHPAIPPEQVDALAKGLLAGILLATSAGELQVSDEWNQLLPQYEFTQAEEFLAKGWWGKE